jgi:predicted membrane-bound spermidine synthase
MNFKNKLFIISFIEGATVMATEICGAKLLAPYFGSSLYVWSSVMAITLGGLASGYFIGGILSRKENKQSILFYILLLAFCYLSLMPYLSKYIFTIAYYLPLIPAVIFSVVFVIFPSMLLMGTTSPLLISLLTNDANKSGSNSGNIYAISTLGGILATFLCGFYLIPNFGISYTLLFFSFILGLVSLLLIKKKSGKQTTLFLIFIISISLISFKSFPKDKNCIYKIDGILGKIEVKDEYLDSTGITRRLIINNIIQSEMDIKSKQYKSKYLSIFESNLCYFKKGKALVLGLGGGLASNILVKNGYEVTGVEFDERVIEIAKKYFYLDKSVSTICSDARSYINTSESKFDLVLIDIYKAEEQPSYLITMESLKLLKGMLNPNAVVAINNHGYLDGEIGKGTQCLLATFKKSGFNLKVCADKVDPNYRNLLIFANIEKTSVTLSNELKSVLIFDNELVNSDDKPIVESLNAKANQAWRINYLKNYILINNVN